MCYYKILTIICTCVLGPQKTGPLLFLQYLQSLLSNINIFSMLQCTHLCMWTVTLKKGIKIPSPHLNCVSALPDKCCRANSTFLLYIFKLSTQYFNKTESHSTLHTNACWKSFISLVDSRVNNVLVTIAPDMNQPLLQFINARDVCLVNTFLNGRPYLTVNWVEVWAV